MRQHIKIPLAEEDFARLEEAAAREMRPVGMQAEYILRNALTEQHSPRLGGVVLSPAEAMALAGAYELLAGIAARVRHEKAGEDQSPANEAEVPSDGRARTAPR